MARKLALLVLVLLVALAFWLWKGSSPSAVPLAAPEAPAAQPRALDSAQTEIAPKPKRAEIPSAAAAPSANSARLVVLCKAKETGAPLAAQHVSLFNPHGGAQIVPQLEGARGKLGDRVTTGADGRAEIELPPGIATMLQVNPAAHFANASERRDLEAFSAGEQRELVIELATREDAHFYARVTSRETHAPIAGAEIQGGPSPLVTDADGRFDVANSSWSMQQLSIAAAGYAVTLVAAQPGHETPEKALPIELEHACTLVGLLQGGGESLKSGRVWMVVTTEGYRLTGQDPSQLGSIMAEYDHTWRAEFDASGRAEIAGLVPNAPLRISVTAGPRRLVELADPITIPPGATREVELKVANTCKLTGIVRDDSGAVVPGLTLWLLRTGSSPRLHVEFYEADDRVGDAKTDEQGRFTIPKVSPGTWRLCPEAKMYRDGAPIPADAAAPFAILVEIQTDEAEHQVELVVHRGLTITGKVLDPEGKPVNNAGVGGRTGETWVGTSCGEDGTFVLGPLLPGSYTLDASPSFHKELADSEDVQAEAGAHDVVLRVGGGGKLSCRVVDAKSGEGVVAQIAVSVPADPLGMIQMPTSNPDGRFELTGLLPGTYALCATTHDGRVGCLRGVELAAGGDLHDLVIQIQPGAKLRVRYTGAKDFCSTLVYQDGAVVATDGVEKGTSKTFSAPAGSVKVVCHIGGKLKKVVRELTLKAGEEQELVIKDED